MHSVMCGYDCSNIVHGVNFLRRKLEHFTVRALRGTITYLSGTGWSCFERLPMATIVHRDVSALSDLVRKERGKAAMQYVSRKVSSYRREGDRQNALLWSMVLAEIYHSDSVYSATMRKSSNFSAL